MLDRSVYLGTTDYELEIEYDRDRESFAREVLNRIASLFVQKGMLTGTQFGSFEEENADVLAVWETDEKPAVVFTAEGKKLFQCLEHYATSPSSFTLMWASHMVL